MADYQLTANANVIFRSADGAHIPNDPNNRDWQDYQTWVASGNTADPYVPPAPPPVTTVSQRQARIALSRAGLLPQVESAVQAAGGEVQITWDYADVINRSDPLITTIGTQLNLTSAQIDQLFQLASLI
jgi:hypothetical protein